MNIHGAYHLGRALYGVITKKCASRLRRGPLLCIYPAYLVLLSLCLPLISRGNWQPQFGEPIVVGAVEKDALDEISGTAISRSNPAVLWMHNDKGGANRVYALTWSGRLLGKYEMDGVSDRDYEDIAVGPGPTPDASYLYVGNIGDNGEQYDSVWVYRFPEPAVDLDQDGDKYDVFNVEEIELVYPYGPRDAEALMLDANGDIYLATKRSEPVEIYRARFPQVQNKSNTLEWVCNVNVDWKNGDDDRTVTGGDISANGGLIALRGFHAAYLWVRGPGQSISEALSGQPLSLPLPLFEEQGEAIAFTPDAMGYVTASEGENQPIYYTPRVAVGDVNDDGLTNLADFAVIGQYWLAAACKSCEGADFDGNNAVCLNDVSVFASYWLAME